VFLWALRNTFIFAFVSPLLVIAMGDVVAQVLLKNFRATLVVRFLILMPWATPISLATLGCGSSTPPPA